jgi:sigma-B regulation protein RsbU (phosphoserine phosphatase)
MAANSLILVGSNQGCLAGAPVEPVLALWPARERPAVARLTIEQAMAEDAIFDRCKAVWFVIDGPESAALHELIARLQDRHRAAIISRRDETLSIGATYQDNVAVAPFDAPPVAVCAMLRTLYNQSDIVRALLMEIEILNAHNGGLATQFDKLDEELRLAAQLQREFLPGHVAAHRGIDFRVLFRPASYVSGDIYDIIRLDENHIGFFIADAVGHGVPAALMTVYIKRSLRTGNRSDDSGKEMRIIPPAEALAHLNRDMVRQQQGHVRFATACYGIINCETKVLSFSRAGHPYPLILRADGSHEWIEPEGGLLGVFPDETFETAQVQLNSGDRLLLYSDGFEVAFPDVLSKTGQKSRMASTAYAEEFKALANGTLDEAFTRLAQRLDEQSGSLNQIDDLTALLVGIDDGARVEPVEIAGQIGVM